MTVARNLDPGLETAVDRCISCHDQCMSASSEVVVTGRQDLVMSRVANVARSLMWDAAVLEPAAAQAVFYTMLSGAQADACVHRDRSQLVGPFVRYARARAVEAGLGGAWIRSAERSLIDSANETGVEETPLGSPVESTMSDERQEAAVLVHGAASRRFAPGSVAAARALLAEWGYRVIDCPIASFGRVEADLGLEPLARQRASEAHHRLASVVDRATLIIPLDAVGADAILGIWPTWGLAPLGTISNIAKLAASHQARPPSPIEGSPQIVTCQLPTGESAAVEPADVMKSLRQVDCKVVTVAGAGDAVLDDGPIGFYPDEAIASAVARRCCEAHEVAGPDAIVVQSPWSIRNLGDRTPLPVLDLTEVLAARLGLPYEARSGLPTNGS